MRASRLGISSSQLVEEDGIRLEVPSARMLSAEIIDLVKRRQATLVCIADLPPSPPSRTRYLVRKLRAALPDVKILIGRWAPPEGAEEDRSTLVEAGATHVASTLVETRDQLRALAAHERQRSNSASRDRANGDDASSDPFEETTQTTRA